MRGASAAGASAARVKNCAAPAAPASAKPSRIQRSQRPSSMLELGPEQAEAGTAADRRDELDHGGGRRLGQDHAAGAQGEAAPTRLGDGPPRLPFRAPGGPG